MMTKYVGLFCIAALAACAGDFPQQDLEALASAQERRANGEQSRELREYEEQRIIRAATGFAILGEKTKVTQVANGWLGRSGASYQVFGDGTAQLFQPNGEPTELDDFETRLDGGFLAGADQNRIIGTAQRGTLVSWNASNLSQQVILRPQSSTFGQTRVLDAADVAGRPSLAMAVEGRRLELWSLVSGNLIRSGQMPEGIAPRVIMPDSSEGAIVFGTQTGDVRIWSSGNASQLLYKHDGPVLSIISLGKGRIASSSKDGSVQVWSTTRGDAIGHLQFDTAVYDIAYSPQSDTISATPALGDIGVISLANGQSAILKTLGQNRFSRGEFDADGRAFVARTANGKLFHWTIPTRNESPTVFDSRSAMGLDKIIGHSNYVDFAVASALGNGMIAASTDQTVELLDARLARTGHKGQILRSDVTISGIEIAADSQTLLVALEDGRMLRILLRQDLSGPIQFGPFDPE